MTSLFLFGQGLTCAFETRSPQENESGTRFLPAFPARRPKQCCRRGARALSIATPLLQGAQVLPRVSAGHRRPNTVTGCLRPPSGLLAGLSPSAALFPSWPRMSLGSSLGVAIPHPRFYPPPSLPLWPRCAWGRNPGERGLEPTGIRCVCPRAARSGRRGPGAQVAARRLAGCPSPSQGPPDYSQMPRSRLGRRGRH